MNSTYCEFWPDDPSKCWTIYILFKCFSAISILGCLFILITIILFKLYQYFVQRLILFMTISALIKLFSNIFSVNDYPKSCVAQAFIMSVFGWAELLWVCCITANIAMVVHGINSQNYEKWFHVFTWIFSVCICLLPFIGHHYGPAGMWCWIDRKATGLRFGTWYIPLLIVIIGMVLVYVFITVRAYCTIDIDQGFRYEAQQGRRLFQEEVKPLFAYPVIYFLFTLPVLIYRVDDAVSPDKPPRYALLVLSVITSPMLGAINAIAFALYGDTLKMLSWNNIKAAVVSCREGSHVSVTHNYDVSDDQALLYHQGDEDIQFRSTKREKYVEEAVA